MLSKNSMKKFDLDVIKNMREKGSRVLYVHFLDRFVPAIVGSTTWKRLRLQKTLDEYFTVTDEAFLLLCYDCYSDKWVQDYRKKRGLNLEEEKQVSTGNSNASPNTAMLRLTQTVFGPIATGS